MNEKIETTPATDEMQRQREQEHAPISQQTLDDALAGWRANPGDMRKKILDGYTSGPDYIMRMQLAGQEEAAAMAMIRGETNVVYGDPYLCPICTEVENRVLGPMERIPHPHNFFHAQVIEPPRARRTPVWMGPERRWVCDGCLTPLPFIEITPNKEATHGGTHIN